nr:chemotaxis protein CheA [Paracidobacterium acidisoli]
MIESQEGLDRMERCLTELETRPEDAELIAEIFRSVHTIKGTTGFLGFGRLESLSHAGENLLGLLREGRMLANAEIISGLLSLLDGLRSILQSIEESGAEGQGDDAAMIAHLQALQQPGPAVENVPEAVAEAAPVLAGVAVAEESAAVAATAPSAAASGTVKRRVRRSRGTGPAGRPRPASESGAPGDPDRSDPPRSAPDPSPGPRPDLSSGLSQPAPAAEAPKPARPAAAPSAPPSSPASEIAAQRQPSAAADSTLRVDVDLLNRMMNLVGELVLTRNQILQATAADAGFALLSRRLDMVTADLREAVMKARMQPVSHVFSKFPRLVRDLAQTLGKRIRLEMEGQETELDKSLLEAIKDPLTHVVRNACDHGIEAAEARLAAGKEAEGLVRLRALQDGSHVIVEVIDDGGGLRVEKIRAKALDRRLITPQQAAQMSEREVLQLIFLAGFSTAEAVTSVSGRGVGMDVVRNNVEKIGGKVEIDSKVGRGTVMRLRIPLTLAIIPALIVRSRDRNFALPQGTLTELVHLASDQAAAQIEWLGSAALFRLRERLLPLIFLKEMLALDRMPEAAASDQATNPVTGAPSGCYIAVLNADGRRYGLVVDGLADPEEIVVKPLSPILKSIGLFSGATILGNGETALILDPGALATRAGVGLSAEEEEETATEVQTAGTGDSEYLLVETGSELAALPLTTVLRIERIPRSRIEHIGRTPVLRFEGTLLPVEDSAQPVPPGKAGEQTIDEQMTIVVCLDGRRHVGMAVSQVLDVAGGRQLEEAGTGAVATGVTLLKDRVTSVVNLARIPALPPHAAPEESPAAAGETEAPAVEFSPNFSTEVA